MPILRTLSLTAKRALASIHTARLQWPLVAATMLCLAIYNIGARYQLTRDVRVFEADVTQRYADLAGSQVQAAALIGRTIVWPGTLKGTDGHLFQRDAASTDYRFLLRIDGADCLDLQNVGTRLFSKLQRTVGPEAAAGSLIAVVNGRDVPLIRSYQLANRFTFPVLLDDTGDFGSINGLDVAPLLLALDRSDRIIAAFAPVGRGRDLVPVMETSLIGLLELSVAEPRH